MLRSSYQPRNARRNGGNPRYSDEQKEPTVFVCNTPSDGVAGMTQQDNQNQKRTNEAAVSGTIHRIVHGTRAEEQRAACQSPAGLTLSIRSCFFPPSLPGPHGGADARVQRLRQRRRPVRHGVVPRAAHQGGQPGRVREVNELHAKKSVPYRGGRQSVCLGPLCVVIDKYKYSRVWVPKESFRSTHPRPTRKGGQLKQRRRGEGVRGLKHTRDSQYR